MTDEPTDKPPPIAALAVSILLATTLICLALAPAGGCFRSPPASGTPVRTLITIQAGPVTGRVSKTELFRGEMKRMQPHLGLTGAAVRFAVAGKGLYLRLRMEVWEKGKEPRWLGSGSSGFDGPGEASFTLSEVTDANGVGQFRLVEVTRDSRDCGSARTTFVDRPVLHEVNLLSELLELESPVEVKRAEWVTLWAYTIDDSREVSFLGSIEEKARAARWALVIKGRWELEGDADDNQR